MIIELERNAGAQAYFQRGNRNARAAYRRALRDAGIELPSWAQDRRNVAATSSGDVATFECSYVGERLPDPTDEDLTAAALMP